MEIVFKSEKDVEGFLLTFIFTNIFITGNKFKWAIAIACVVPLHQID